MPVLHYLPSLQTKGKTANEDIRIMSINIRAKNFFKGLIIANKAVIKSIIKELN